MRISSIRILRLMSFAVLLLTMSAAGFAQISISINIAPPELPVYEQPAIPGDGYLWVPGYWAYSDDADGYFWVPGTWVMPPQAGLLWTPGYWGWGDRGYVFNDGYWGPTGASTAASVTATDITVKATRARALAGKPVLLQPLGEQCGRRQYSQRL